MAKVTTTVHQAGQPWDVEAVAEIVRATKEKQIRDAFRTQGRSNETNWLPLRPLTVKSRGEGKALINTGTLQRSIQVEASVQGWIATITVGTPVRVGRYNLGRLHQFGVKGPILPVRAKALFIPLLNRGVKTGTLTKSGKPRYKPPKGGRFRAHRSKRLGNKTVGFKRYGQVQTRKGKVKGYVDLQRDKDFVLSHGIFPTPEKRGQAIPARPFATMTDNERWQIVQNVRRLLSKRR